MYLFIHIWPEKDSHKQIETIKYTKILKTFEGERKPDERLKIYICVSRISLVRPRNLKVKMNNNNNNKLLKLKSCEKSGSEAHTKKI